MTELSALSREAMMTLTASDLAYGLKAGFITPYQSVKISESAVSLGNPDEVFMDFACIKADDVSGELDQATAALIGRQFSSVTTEVSMRKWLYWEINSLVERGVEDGELFLAIEEIYANNDYPDYMKHLIYYTPVSDPQTSSPGHLKTKILDFLDVEKTNLF